MSNEDKMKLLQETLSDEAKAAMEKLLADGYTMDEVMKLMAAHGNDVAGLTAAAAALSNEETEFKKKMNAEEEYYKNRYQSESEAEPASESVSAFPRAACPKLTRRTPRRGFGGLAGQKGSGQPCPLGARSLPAACLQPACSLPVACLQPACSQLAANLQRRTCLQPAIYGIHIFAASYLP